MRLLPGSVRHRSVVPESSNASLREEARVEVKPNLKRAAYFLPAAFRRAAHLAFMASESFFRPAAVSPPFFFPAAFAGALPAPALRLAHRAFIDSDSLRRPAALSPPFFRPGAFAAELLPVPFRLAQRAFAAAASFARVAADMGRRRRPPERRPLPRPVPELVEPPKRVDKRCSSALICCLIERACVSF